MPIDPIARLQSEHQQMNVLLEAMDEGLGADPADTATVLKKAAAFEALLARHERCEEDVLFPAIQGVGPVQLVLQEHRRLAPLRDGLHTALKNAQADDNDDNLKILTHHVQQIAYCLSGHFMKEEQLVFHIARASLTMDRLAEMGKAMNQLETSFNCH